MLSKGAIEVGGKMFYPKVSPYLEVQAGKQKDSHHMN